MDIRASQSPRSQSATAPTHFPLEIVSWRAKIRRLKTLIQFASLVTVSTALLCGCGSGSSKVGSADLKAFDSASPELKELWQQSQAAAGTNDYVQAILALRALMPRDLSPEQRAAVETAMGAYDAKLTRAAARGDPEAKKALETLRTPDAQLGR